MLTFTIDGPPGTVTLRAMLLAFQNQLSILGDLDAAIAGQSEPALDWYVADLQMNSVSATLESRPTAEDLPPGHDRTVIRTYRNGFDVIEREGRSPAYFSEHSLRSAKSTLKLIGREGVTGFHIRADSVAPDTLSLTARAAVNVDQLIRPAHKGLGSVEGRLNMISLAGARPKFEVYDALTKKPVSCRFEPHMLDAVKDALGRRVVVAGVVTYNGKGEPFRIVLDSPIRVLRDRPQLPTTEDIERHYPTLTGTVSSREYLDTIRE
jgi:hypothetical protein